MGKIIAFANQKGGVGKTTTCVNVSSYLAAMGKKVLLLDMDPQGNATTGLGVQKSTNTKTLYNVFDGECELAEVIQPTYLINLDIVPATVDLAGAEIDLVQMEDREKILKKNLQSIKNTYDYITIDCPPSLGLITVNALTSVNSVLIPMQCEFYSLEGLTQLMNTIKLVKKHLNPQLDIEGVALTMKDNRSNHINNVADEIKRFFGPKVFNTVIPKNIRLAEAPSFGESIITYDFNSKGATAYMGLAQELLERNNDTYTPITKYSKILRKED